jgi:hypothetical protein
MANTLTSLIADAYKGLDVVSRELVGFIPAVTRDSDVAQAAIGETVYSYTAPAAEAGDLAAAATVPDDGDQTFGNKTVAITKARRVPIRWNGEQTKQMDHSFGTGNMIQDQFAQAFRTLTNEMESDLAALHVSASRAYGTESTTPFASTLADTAQVKKVLDDNGAPASDRHCVIDTSAGAAMRTLTQLTNINQSGDSTMLRQGELLNLHGFAIRESAQVEQDVAIGDSDGNFTSAATGFAVGVTSIPLITGANEIIAGDIILFTGDTNKYVVTTGIDGPGTIVIAEPGLKQALPASAVDVTSVAASVRNLAFSRNAIVLATRTPALPDGGDLAVDRTIITDPYSGLSFELSMYAQYRQMQYEVSAAWGVGAMKDEHMSILLGG